LSGLTQEIIAVTDIMPSLTRFCGHTFVPSWQKLGSLLRHVRNSGRPRTAPAGAGVL
jgi:hypothetical protein